jgi:hypothetical protein
MWDQVAAALARLAVLERREAMRLVQRRQRR